MANDVGKSYGYAGDYSLNYIDIHSYKMDKPVDITGLFSSLEITESIFSPFMTLKLTIIDGVGLMDQLIINGEEFLTIDITASGVDVGYKGNEFFIYKIADRGYVSDKDMVYDIYGISIDGLADINTKISKHFIGQPSDIVKDILKDFIKTNKKVFVEDTKNSVEYISNYWNPAKNIKFLCERSIAKETGSPAYVFFETRDAFVFCSLGRLVHQPTSGEYFYTNNMKNIDNMENKLHIIESLYVDESYNYMNRSSNGALGTRTLIVDSFHKTYDYKYYDYLQAFDDHARLNTVPLMTKETPRSVHSMFQIKNVATNSFTSMPNDNISNWLPRKTTEYATIDTQSIQIDITGDWTIAAGSVLGLYIYSSKVKTKTDNLMTLLDRNLSGRYLVTSLKHVFDRERHTTSIQLNKDSLFDPTFKEKEEKK